MANWSKRRTTTYGKYSKNRTTRTTNTGGSSTISNSTRVGNRRTTNSTTSKNGKVKSKTTITEYNPALGRMVTTRTTSPTIGKSKAPTKSRSKSGSRTTAYRPADYNSSTEGYILLVLFIVIPAIIFILW